ncbi:TetR/AcrR family transcriptional regulator [Nonomuraea guangzhouensis]|uniref:TetR/AcrR family transcriptional regulator n=1 Tax=Nonomuraea guangzhouensis TaxID=1291555 RepID=A0ABW4G8Q3_9ACTN|nr:TetR/AcrR family transcriptional regulator [Nonomuraea guangzhouensis]
MARVGQAAELAASTDTRQRILAEAAALFRRHGYRGTSTRQIAEAVGVRQPTLFYHFPNKQAILEELLALSLDDSLAAADRAAHSPGSPAERLYRYVVGDLAALHRLPLVLSGVYANDVLLSPELSHWADKLNVLYQALRSLIEQGVKSGEFTSIDPALGQTMLAGVTLAHIEYAAQYDQGDPEQLARAGARFILGGLLRDPSQLAELEQLV